MVHVDHLLDSVRGYPKFFDERFGGASDHALAIGSGEIDRPSCIGDVSGAGVGLDVEPGQCIGVVGFCRPSMVSRNRRAEAP